MNLDVILQGDCKEVLKTLPDQSINCCVTSPPYYGLRDYGTGKWEGGNPECPHVRTSKKSDSTITGHKNFDDMNGVSDAIQKRVCSYCGAIRIDSQIGLEETPDEYVNNLVGVFHEAKRVLKDDGTLWLNLGDSYCGSMSGRIDDNTIKGRNIGRNRPTEKIEGLKSKDLIGIPWRVAFALQADGWYLRQDIIWHKPNPMPESVEDRCTKAHEYIFLLSKSSRYYYNHEAIQEKAIHAEDPRAGYGRLHYRGKREGYEGQGQENFVKIVENRNKRSVWSVTTKPFSGAHFATFPEDLIRPCILAGCPEGGVVLDPFSGAGTTALVAKKNGCHYVGIELNPSYIEITNKRLAQDYLFV